MIPLWLEQAATRFWRNQGGPPDGFPRELESTLPVYIPVDIALVSGLTGHAVDEWMAARNSAVRLPCANRALRGAVVAVRGHGIVFLDADDAADDRRFTAAHEAAHFLLDYLLPRERALALMGRAILPVLNGDRPPTTDERIDSALAEVRLGLYVNLMERGAGGRIENAVTVRAESRADVLALHLLAPEQALLSRLPSAHGSAWREEFQQAAEALLCRDFGLPFDVVQSVATRLALEHCRSSARDWL